MSVLEGLHGARVHPRRVRVLAQHLARLVPRGARLLDVGCGDGLLALQLQALRPDVELQGVDVLARADAHIPVRAFDGRRLPWPDGSFDAVMLVDVVHHAEDPAALLAEAARVASRTLLVKDHYRDGFLAGATLRFMDDVGNRRHGVSLPHQYWPAVRWERAFRELGLSVHTLVRDVGLYPFPASLVFGRRLHFVARLDRAPVAARDAWEQAYERFETAAEEVAKFEERLRDLGAATWPRSGIVVDLFCGRGNGLHALRELGLTRVVGGDLSPRLLARYAGPAPCFLGDARSLPLRSGSVDAVVVQGGLHHLERLPEDLDAALGEARRVLRPSGVLAVVEPWSTPYLALAHAACGTPLRSLWDRLDALATMIEHERATYEAWLGRPDEILAVFDRHFTVTRLSRRLGKLHLVASPRALGAGGAPSP